MSALIRKAQVDDLEGIYECLSQMVSWLPDKESRQLISEKFFAQKNTLSVVAQHEDSTNSNKIVGFASLLFAIKVRGGLIGFIEDVIVDETYRDMKIGKELVDVLLADAKQLGIYKVMLECSQENSGFYSKLGFEVSGLSMKWSKIV